MAAKPKNRLTPAEAEEVAVAEFRPLVRRILAANRKGTHELLLSVDDFGRPKIRVRGPYVDSGVYDPR